jgi:tetratricopeptide (TPR) repeat protein
MSVDQYQPEQYLSGPRSVFYVPDNRQIYVIDSGTARILAFDSFGNFIGPVLDYAAEKSKVFMPRAIQLDSSGWLYVADNLSHTILLYGEKSAYRGSFGHRGQFPNHKARNEEDPAPVEESPKTGDFIPADSRLRLPSAIVVQDDGDVWVSDWGNNSVKKFSASFYRKALEYYKKRDFLTAIFYFEKCNVKNESYHLVEFYLAMCHYYLGAAENLFDNKIKYFAEALNYLNVLKLKGEIGIIKNRDLTGRVLYYLSHVQVYIKDN